MAKDYFQDILPPQGTPPKKAPVVPVAEPHEDVGVEAAREPGVRSIRNISVATHAPRRVSAPDTREAPDMLPPPRRSSKRWWLWAVAALLVAFVGLLLFVAMRPTIVRVVPRAHAVVFDSSMQFSAYPRETAATGSLAYIINTTTLEDSAVVPAQGTETVSERATGNVTVFNNYSSEPVKLIRNTRFATPDGLIFRIASEVSIPGKIGAKAGELTVQVTADEAGEKYNVGPISRFTLPGLQSTADMYASVYARSTTAMTGGFVGERPAVAPATLEAARAAVRDRLEQQVRSAAQNQTNPDFIVLPDLIRITYSSLPTTKEEGTNVRIHERAQIEIPAFPTGSFAETVARGVSADAEEGSIVLDSVGNLTARFAVSSSTPALGTDRFDFSIEGSAKLIWDVDLAALAEALAGKDEAAFEAIVAAFPGVEEAYARIQPFWKRSFPADPSDIKMSLEEAETSSD